MIRKVSRIARLSRLHASILRQIDGWFDKETPLITDNPDRQWKNIRSRYQENEFNPLEDQLLDDAGKEVQTACVVRARKTSDASRITDIAIEQGYGVMAIGSLTSAIGAFKAQTQADIHGLKGFVGLQISPNGSLENDIPAAKWEQENGFEKISVAGEFEGMLEIFRSLDPGKNHRVRAWAGLTVAQINDALNDHLGVGHSVFLDLTTFDQAQIGAVVCNGSQGPVRSHASLNLVELMIVDKEGKARRLFKEQAVQQVGLRGCAGVVTEVVLEVIREGQNEFGFFIPLPGGIGDQYGGIVNHLPRVMSSLDKYAESRFEEDPKGRKLVAGQGDVLLKGFEVITRTELRSTYASLNEDSEERGRIGSLLENMRDSHCHVGLLINCTTDVSEDSMVDLLEALFVDDSEEENLFTVVRELQRWKDVYRSMDSDDETEEDIVYFRPSEIKALKRMREAIPIMTRSSKLRGFTTSTDINCRITSEDPGMRKRAYQAIMEIYWLYASDLRDRDFRIYFYGHLHPGDRDADTSGGVDPHVRATYFLEGEDRDKQKRAAEAWVYLKDRKKLLTKHLMSLHGQFGISVEPGEKGLSADYVKWLEEFDPQRAEDIAGYLKDMGGKTFSSRSPLAFSAHPPRLAKGVLDYFWPDPSLDPSLPALERLQLSILYWCQNSHRSAEGKKIIFETVGLLRDWLGCEHDERIYFTESAQKAVHSCVLALVNRRKGNNWKDLRKCETDDLETLELENVQAVVVDKPSLLSHRRLENINCILVVQSSEKIDHEDRAKADAVIYEAESFGTGGELGILITNTTAIRKARMIAQRNKTGYVHSLVEMADRIHETIETPRMPVIAELACMLALRLGETCKLSRSDIKEAEKRQRQFLTLNPGPSQINKAIIDRRLDVLARSIELRGKPDIIRKSVVEVEDKLRRYLSVPADYKIFFTGSATQAMEQTVESLNLDHCVIGIKGAFGERMFTVARKLSKSGVKSVRLRWGEGENHQFKSIAAEMFSKLPANPKKLQNGKIGFFITAHETSTGVQTNIRRLSRELRYFSMKNRMRRVPLRIIDGTSELGFTNPDFREIDVYFGSVQKFLGCPAGLGMMIVSPRAMVMARENEKEKGADDTTSFRTFGELERLKEQGCEHNLRGIIQLGIALEDYLARGGIKGMQKETRRKLDLVKATLGRNRHLASVVVEPTDRSGVLVHLAAVDFEISRLVERVRPIVTIGNGYGPFKGETMRLYLSPNVSEKRLRQAIQGIEEAIDKMKEDGEMLDMKLPRRCRNLDREWAAIYGGMAESSARELVLNRLNRLPIPKFRNR